MPKKIKPKSFKNGEDFLSFLNSQFGQHDTDGDGICDEVEKMIGTNPNKFDTDGDGVGDGDEIRAGRNPLGRGSFKDFFVPHDGNNWRPQAIHPKRIMFYASTAVVTKVLVIMFVLGLPSIAWLSPDVIRNYVTEIISLTNQERKNVSVAPLTENIQLSQAAYAKAEDMLVQSYFSHTGPDGRKLSDWLKDYGYRYTVAGENLAVGFNSAKEAVEAWKESKTHYANMIDPDFSQIGVGVVVGNFENENTMLAAQYFGYPDKIITEVKPEKKPQAILPPAKNKVNRISVSVKNDKKIVKNLDNVKPVIDNSIFVDQEKSIIDYKVLPDKTAIIRADIYTSGDINHINIKAGQHLISLIKDVNQANRWFGQVLLDKKEASTFSTIAPASIALTNNQGKTFLEDLPFAKVVNQQVSGIKQYAWAKDVSTGPVKAIFTVSSLFYKTLFFVNLLALFFSLVVGWNKLHKRTIAAASLTCLLFGILIII
ncbi:MAG: CAP domain-containing protein [Patescibacteria group bacterium]|nr:CAP domain-containing protein [Patescibacteria group bacterium]